MAQITILDESSDGCTVKCRFSIAVPGALQSLLGAVEQVIEKDVRYSSISLTADQKKVEIKSAYATAESDHQASLTQRFALYGTELEA